MLLRGRHASVLTAAILMVTSLLGFATAHEQYGQVHHSEVSRIEKGFLLPSKVAPKHYRLRLGPFLDDATYKGRVTIDLEVRELTDRFTLHTDGLNITHASLHHDGEWLHHRMVLDEESQTVRFNTNPLYNLESPLILSIEFIGKLRDDLSGFFRSPYKREDGSEGYLIVSNMAPTFARRAFPCFDEPALKATFSVSLVVNEKDTALSNMNVVKISAAKHSDSVVVRFGVTPPMSTYLLAITIGELSYAESNDARIPVRVYTSPGNDVELMQYAVDLVARGVNYYEELFDLPYALAKLDLVAVPTFLQGGMENWGLILAHALLFPYDPEMNNADNLVAVAGVLLHEVAHQWFGDIVTMKWWDETWLNEGGASAMTSYCIQALEPTWTANGNFQKGGVSSGVFGLDGYRSSHAIQVPINKPGDISKAFDQISYSKGEMVLNMIREIIGPAAFSDGIARYLKAHSYGNTEIDDLLDSLGDGSDTIKAFMKSWIGSPGYPVVKVMESHDGLQLEQYRFLYGGDLREDENDMIWTIPLRLRTSEGMDGSLMQQRVQFVRVDWSRDDFYLLNADHTSLFRTLYTPERLEKLTKAANDGLLTAEERRGLVSDTCSLAKAGSYKTSTCLKLIQALALHETEFSVWVEIAVNIHTILKVWADHPRIYEALQNSYRKLTSSVAHRFGWNITSEDAFATQRLKALMFMEAGVAGDEKVLEAAKEMIEKIGQGKGATVPAALKRPVYKLALLEGGELEYKIVIEEIRTTRLPFNRRMGLEALFSTNNPVLVHWTLDMILSGKFDASDASAIFGGIGSSLIAPGIVWQWTKENWSHLRSSFPDALGIQGSLLRAATRHMTSWKELQELEEFMEKEKLEDGTGELSLSLEVIRAVAGWVERDTGDLEAFFGLDVGDEL